MRTADAFGLFVIGVSTVCRIIRYFTSGRYSRDRHVRAMLRNPDLPDAERVALLIDGLLDSPFVIQ